MKKNFYALLCIATYFFTANLYGMDNQLSNAQAYHGASSLYKSCAKKIMANYPSVSLDDQTILDIGCATGKTTKHISKKALLVDGIDINPEMVQFAQQRYGLKPNLTFQTGNIEEFVPQRSYDIAVSHFCLHWVKNKEKALKVIHESLKPQGILFATMKNSHYSEHIGIKVGLELVKDFLPSGANPEDLVKSMGVSYMTDEQVKELVEKAGFKLISLNQFEVQEKAHGLDELRKFYKYTALNLPFIAHFSQEEKLALLEEYIVKLADVLPQDEQGNYILGGNETIIYAQKK